MFVLEEGDDDGEVVSESSKDDSGDVGEVVEEILPEVVIMASHVGHYYFRL